MMPFGGEDSYGPQDARWIWMNDPCTAVMRPCVRSLWHLFSSLCETVQYVVNIRVRFEAIVPGNPEIVVEYQNKLYYLETEEKLQKFMRSAPTAVIRIWHTLIIII